MKLKVDSDALLTLLLISLLSGGYVMLVYVFVIAIGMPHQFKQLNTPPTPPWWLNLIAFLPIALTFFPVYHWVRRGVRDFVYGQHDNPYPALAYLGQRLDSMTSPQTILPAFLRRWQTCLNCLMSKLSRSCMAQTMPRLL